MRFLAKAPLLAVFLLLPVASPVLGQSILVHVTESESGEPIAGAFISLLDGQGDLIRSALTGQSGRFLFPVSDPGIFQVKAEMIGRETKFSSPFTLRVGESGQVVIALSYHAIALAGIQVEADERCRIRPDEASELARVWDEARTALAVQAWTEQEGLYRLDISTYDRDLDSSGRRVERETRKETTTVTRTPFGSLPAEDLMSGGFIRPQEGGGHQYYGPDAQVLLSDLFLDTHCLRLTRSGDLPGSIGLAFEPVRGGELRDVEGTLWLDQETANLQFMEYGYTSAPYREARGVAGGRIEFEAMPNGAWIIERWWIRAPIVSRQPYLARGGDSGIRVVAIRETGGEVTGATTLNQQRILEVERGSLTGLVWDSVLSGPLEGATVFLSGTQYSSVTDAEGRFLVEEILGGVFTASFMHPRLDSLGILATNAEVEVTPGEASELRLAIPSSETILLAACRDEEREEGAAVLSGTVRDRTSGEPVPGAMVRVDWQEVHRVDPVLRATDEWIEVQATAEGYYTACGIPLDELFQIQASFLDLRGDLVEDIFQTEEHRLLDLGIDLPEGILTDRNAGVRLIEEYGAQGVQGVLVEPESGDPVRGAEVTLTDGSGRITVTGVSNQKGFFRLLAPVPGRYILTAQALGYAEVKDEVVEVSLGHLAVLEVQMPPDALELEPLVVTAERRAFHLEMDGFYERKELGGIFITPEVLEKRQPRK
ncbi:MAG: carboxypeptidase regulatory-like domain-containing protein, partial [Longimicrobiales bacterium]|nr:carboxypeptidase regulatory-like domain-containing protein [Longimicrobiales bacterium]